MARKPDVLYIRYETDGSAARSLEPIVHRAKTKLPEPKRKADPVIRLDPLAFVGIVVSAVMVVLMSVSVFQLIELQDRNDQMQEYIQILESKNADLTDTFWDECDLQELEEKALALGMIPVDQAQRIKVSIPVDENGEETSIKKSGWTFLTGLFD